MTVLRLMTAGLILATMLATPAVARDKKSGVRNAEDAYAAAPTRKQRCAVRAADEGAFATAPYRKPPCEPVRSSY
jgi:hypothetical protein